MFFQMCFSLDQSNNSQTMQFYLEYNVMEEKKNPSNKVHIPLILSECFQITNDMGNIKSGE